MMEAAISEPKRFRFPSIELNPKLVAFAETLHGKILCLVIFAVILRWLNEHWLVLTIGATICAFAGAYRGRIVPIVTLAVLFYRPDWFEWMIPASVLNLSGPDSATLQRSFIALFLMISVIALLAIRKFPDSFLSKRFLRLILALFVLLLVGAASGVLKGKEQMMLWLFVSTFAAYFWFLSYGLADQRTKSRQPVWNQFGAFRAIWSSSTTPFGKGAVYLQKMESKESPELAATQIKALKLLAWVAILKAISIPFHYMAGNLLQIPTAEAAFAHQMAGRADPWYICWASIVYSFFKSTFDMAIWGNTYIAVARMSGYRLLRNTYRPLSSRTIAEFWNRYYFYYKELMVDFFFYPTFLRYFKTHKRLRIFFATFMAAGVGNFLFHFIRDHRYLAEAGLIQGIAGFQTFAFYCTVLGLAIGLSQMRSLRRKHKPGWIRGQLVPSFCVILFFCMMEPFMYTYSPYTLKEHLRFVLHLFGVGTWI